MIEALRPQTLGDILDRTVHVYRSGFLLFFGIALIPAGFVLVCAGGVFLYVAWLGSGPGASLRPDVVGFISLLLLGLGGLILGPACLGVTALGTAALTHAGAGALLGEKTTIRDAYKKAWKRGWRYCWLLAMQFLAIGAAPIVVWTTVVTFLGILVALSRPAGGAGASTALGMVMLLMIPLLGGYALWMLMRLCLAFPACVVEDLGAWTALKRGVLLSKGTRGRILLLYLLGTALTWLLSMLLTVPVIVVGSLIPGATTAQHSATMGGVFLFTLYAAAFAVQAFTKPIYAIALVGFYFDARIRKEGFDIEWMMRQAGMIGAPASPPPAAPWLPPIARLAATAAGSPAPAPETSAEMATHVASPDASLVASPLAADASSEPGLPSQAVPHTQPLVPEAGGPA